MAIDLETLAEKWISEQLIHTHGNQVAELSEDSAIDMVLHLPYESTGQAWEFVERVLEKTESTEVLASLGAGTLETLISVDSGNAESKLRELINRFPVMADVLHGIWKHNTPDAVWQKILKLRS